jgi:hypothetical protein
MMPVENNQGLMDQSVVRYDPEMAIQREGEANALEIRRRGTLLKTGTVGVLILATGMVLPAFLCRTDRCVAIGEFSSIGVSACVIAAGIIRSRICC